jgi:hypothetical protein
VLAKVLDLLQQRLCALLFQQSLELTDQSSDSQKLLSEYGFSDFAFYCLSKERNGGGKPAI